MEESAAHILTLPAEIRLHIYSHLLKPAFDLNLCGDLVESRLANTGPGRKRSPLLTFFQQRNIAAEWTRNHGLHLAATCSLLRHEYLAQLKDAKIRLVVHCSNCLERWQNHMSRDLGIKTPLLTETRLRVDFGASEEFTWLVHGLRSTPDILDAAINDFRAVINKLYGNLDLLDPDDLSSTDKTRVWHVVRIKTIGMVPQAGSDPSAPLPAPDDDADDDDKDDDIDDDKHFIAAGGSRTAFTWRKYAILQGVKELEKQTKCWDVSSLKSGDRQRVREMIEMSSPAGPGEWRRSLAVQLDWKGRSRSRLVCREEIWLSVRLNAAL